MKRIDESGSASLCDDTVLERQDIKRKILRLLVLAQTEKTIKDTVVVQEAYAAYTSSDELLPKSACAADTAIAITNEGTSSSDITKAAVGRADSVFADQITKAVKTETYVEEINELLNLYKRLSVGEPVSTSADLSVEVVQDDAFVRDAKLALEIYQETSAGEIVASLPRAEQTIPAVDHRRYIEEIRRQAHAETESSQNATGAAIEDNSEDDDDA